MYRALEARDPGYDGVFVTAVRTTGIFCRPTCPAKRPARENVTFFPGARDALFAGFRPCKRCRPMDAPGESPPWVARLLDELEKDPTRRWTDEDLRRLGLGPERVRRWFRTHHGMTFHAYHRARRLGLAMGRLRNGAGLSETAFDSGFESLSGFRDAFHGLVGGPPGRHREERHLVVDRILTPLGPMLTAADDEEVWLLEFADRRMLEKQLEGLRRRAGAVFTPGTNPVLDRLRLELEQYFGGERRRFDVPLALPGSDFQRDAWEALRAIPYGETRSYADQARAIGRPTAVRAVARANGQNRLAIVIPCHRVVGNDGRLCGYGGGVWRKRFLLELEQGRAAG